MRIDSRYSTQNMFLLSSNSSQVSSKVESPVKEWDEQSAWKEETIRSVVEKAFVSHCI